MQYPLLNAYNADFFTEQETQYGTPFAVFIRSDSAHKPCELAQMARIYLQKQDSGIHLVFHTYYWLNDINTWVHAGVHGCQVPTATRPLKKAVKELEWMGFLEKGYLLTANSNEESQIKLCPSLGEITSEIALGEIIKLKLEQFWAA